MGQKINPIGIRLKINKLGTCMVCKKIITEPTIKILRLENILIIQ